MPSRKRAKFRHPAEQDPDATNQHRWDDAALLDSWDEALQEYKRYYSLHARGIAPDDALRAYDAAIAGGADEATAVAAVYGEGELPVYDDPAGDNDDHGEGSSDDQSAAMDEDDDENGAEGQDGYFRSNATKTHAAPDATQVPPDATGAGAGSQAKHTPAAQVPPDDTGGGTSSQATHTPAAQAPPMNITPGPLVSGIQDDALKSAMMAWYYAGYYTGLHEGEQKAYAIMRAQQQQDS